MKIISLKYWNNAEEWGFDEIYFFDLTLLVGASGVGKTQILKAIMDLKKIASGNRINGVTWSIKFENQGVEYFWEGEIKLSLGYDKKPQYNIEPRFGYEKFYHNAKMMLERTEKGIFFDGKRMPRLTSRQSILQIFRGEDRVVGAIESFKNIILRDNTQKKYSFLDSDSLTDIEHNYGTIEKIRESDLDIVWKLWLLYGNLSADFERIKEAFIDVFPLIIDLKLGIETLPSYNVDDYTSHPEHTPEIFIKEKHVKNWIPQERISSGMLRTLIQISEMYLLSTGTVVLIDEFENSLGVNCIDVLTEDLVFEHSRLQFIATSHHPYIINKIPYEYWKIVTRKGGKIKTLDAKKFNLGESHHDRFLNLVNLPQYKTGMETVES